MNSKNMDLDKFFYPRSLAIIGVAREGLRIGGVAYLHKFMDAGYPGKIYPINPKADEILGLKAYPNLASLPETPDMAIVCVAAKYVPGVLEECAAIGLKHVHIFTSGFKEMGTKEGDDLEKRVAEICRETGVMVVGPNCMGTYCPRAKLTPWGAIPGLAGSLGIISQSGLLIQRLIEYVYHLGIGVEKAVSLGNGTVLDSLDFLEYMAKDEKIKVIAMYLESVEDGPRFLRLCREVSSKKPIILLKGGLTQAGALTAASHTGAMSGDQALWQALFRQARVIQVETMEEWEDAVIAFSLLHKPNGRGVFVIGLGGGYSVLYGDTCIKEGLKVPALSPKTMDWICRHLLPAGSIAGNPLDMVQTFTDFECLAEVLELAYEDENVDMIVVDRLITREPYHIPAPPGPLSKTIEVVNRNGPKKPVVFIVDSEGGDPELAAEGARLRAQFGHGGLPLYPSMRRAARALARLYRYYNDVA